MKFIQSIEVLIISTLLFVGCVVAWDQDDLEIFDLVEEVNQNFYELLKIKQVIWFNGDCETKFKFRMDF